MQLKQAYNGLQLKKKRIACRLIAAGVLVVVLIAAELIKLSPSLAQFFAKWVSRPLRTVAGFVTSWFTFSVFELLVVLAVIFGVLLIATIIFNIVKKKKFKIIQKLTGLLLVVVSVVTVYSLTAGFDYARPAPAKPWLTANVTTDGYRQILYYFAEDAAQLSKSFEKDENGNSVSPYTFEEIAELMQAEAQKYAGGDYGWYAPLPKKVVNSWWLDWTSILGIMFAPTNEVNINTGIGDFYLPYYMAHELGHALGLMSEREANIFAAYVTLNSDNAFVRYSGYRNLLYDLSSVFYELEAHTHSVDNGDGTFSTVECERGAECEQFSPTLKEYYRLLGETYRKDDLEYYTPVAPAVLREFSGWVNDVYLKISGLLEGSGSYDTGGFDILPPPQPEDPDAPWEPTEPTIVYSEVQKIFIYIYQSKK